MRFIRSVTVILLGLGWLVDPIRGGEPVPLRIEAAADARRPTIVWEMGPQVSAQLGERLSDDGSNVLRLVRVDEQWRGALPVFSSYVRVGQTLRMTPAVQLAPGAVYRVTVVAEGVKLPALEYRVPENLATSAARVERVYPTSDRLPANLLKFYLYFSASMRDTEGIFDHLHLIDSSGQAVHDPWRRQSLWSDDGRRLTLLIHPGRIKKGVNLREELGPVLRPGETYTLVIDRAVLDASGQPLAAPWRKTFLATAEVNSRVAVGDWKLAAPQSQTSEPLRITFDRALDHALARRLLRVTNARGEPLAGSVELGPDERQCRWIPHQPWALGLHTLDVDEVLEDLAGNTVTRVFDTDLEQGDMPGTRRTRTFSTLAN